MTMIAAPVLAPNEVTQRKPLTPAERRLILERQDHECPACKGPLRTKIDGQALLVPMIDEHIIPLGLGGSNDLSNRELRCVPCAREKTRVDRKAIAKAARIRRRLTGMEPRKQKIRSRGFPRDPLHWKNV